jgi:hypothetical protein
MTVTAISSDGGKNDGNSGIGSPVKTFVSVTLYDKNDGLVGSTCSVWYSKRNPEALSYIAGHASYAV